MGSIVTSKAQLEKAPREPDCFDLVGYFDRRPEVGFWRMLANLALEPRNIFKPKERRKIRKGFAIAAFTVVGFVAWFAWFNLIR